MMHERQRLKYKANSCIILILIPEIWTLLSIEKCLIYWLVSAQHIPMGLYKAHFLKLTPPFVCFETYSTFFSEWHIKDVGIKFMRLNESHD